MPSGRVPVGRLGRRIALVGALVALASFSTAGLAAGRSPAAQDSPPRPQSTYGVGRFSGADRFATAADISYHTFTNAVLVKAVYIANAWNFPDALAGAAAAGVVPGPILLANQTGALHASTIGELQRLVPQVCIILGGGGAISNDVMNLVAHYCHATVRYYGTDRFATAVDVSSHTFTPASLAKVAYVANASNFPDALTGAAAAGFQHGPILLANTTGALNAKTVAELHRLDPAKIVILGGPGAISHEVEESLQIYGSTTRYQGANRFATAADISKKVFADPTKVQTVYIANAYNFPDALAGAAAAGWTSSGLSQGPILLADKNLPLDAATVAELQRIQPQRIVVLGGTGAISQALENSLDQYLGPPGP